MKKNDFTQQTTDKIIEALKNGTAPWIKPWKGEDLRATAPFNGASGTRYRGINTINLGMTAINNGYTDPRWFTYNQARGLEAQVKKGEKATLVQHWIFAENKDKLDDNGNKIFGKDGKPEKELVKLERPKVVYHNVFNADQIDNVPELKQDIEQLSSFEVNKTAETILKNSGADITHSKENRAYYSPQGDYIVLPEKENFKSEGSYYATALHELGHWTGHESRLDRDLANPFGSKAYAKEELRAEIGSFLLSSDIGIDYDPGQHMSYIDSWVSILEDQPNELFKAAADATKILSYVKEFEISQELEQKQEIEEIKNLEEITNDIEIEQNNIQSAEIPTLKKENFKEFFSAIENSEIANSLIGGQNWANWEDEENGGHYKIEQILYNKLAWALEDPSNIEEIENTLEDVKLYFAAIGKGFPITANIEEHEDYFSNVIDKHFEVERQKREELEKTKGNEMTNIAKDNTLLFVPYSEKEAAKKVGARWDNNQKSWYAPAGSNLDDFNKWRNKAIKAESTSNVMVIKSLDDLGEVFKKLDIEMPDDLRMDGSMHRIPLNSSIKGKKDAAYTIHNDTSIAGWVKNWATNEKENFVINNGLDYSPEQQEKVLIQSKELSEKREQEREQLHLKTAAKLENEYNNARWSYNEHPYLKAKGLDKNYYTKQDQRGNLLIPLKDINGKLWTTQRIFSNGTKTNGVIRTAEEKAANIEYSAKKQGCFFTVGAKDISKVDPIIVTEGFATAASVFEATKIPTIAAVDAGNIDHVLKAIKEKYPNKEIIIAGDNDVSKELEGKPNVGKITALSMAKKYDAKAAYPMFNSDEKSKGLSDFNDLANSRGLGEVKKQLSIAIDNIKAQTKAQTQTKEKAQKIQRDRTKGVGVSL